ncbi:MAG TPA: LysR family transcriptional regulator [Stellaceae bacterium]|nr:LysR family transcriptional regulator [Stellaceae bacterium]
MAKPIEWDRHIGRRLQLRDLFVFLTVTECSSMGRAAAKLGVATPSVSEAIAGLEHAVGARLLDRSPKGVVTTPYGDALLLRARAAFDELRQGVRDIEFIGDEQAGELRIGCPESITAGFLLPILRLLTSIYPRLRFDVRQVEQPTIDYPELRDRKVDLALARWGNHPGPAEIESDLAVEILLNDPFFLVVSETSKWARRRKLDLGELVDARFVVPSADVWGGALVVEAFRRRGLPIPKFAISTLSISLRNEMIESGDFVTLLTSSVIRTFGQRYSLKVLPIELPAHRSPIGIVTLKHRTAAPAVKLFVQCAREIAKSIAPHARSQES